MESHCIYSIKNKNDNKRYIGYTTTSRFEERMKEHQKAAFSGTYGLLYDAIRRDNWESFEKVIIQKYSSIEEASNGEQYWIEYYKTKVPNFGYNKQEGGLSDKFIKDYNIRRGNLKMDCFLDDNETSKLPLPPKMKSKEFKKFAKHPYIKAMRKSKYQILRTKREDKCKKCGTTILIGTYVLWRRGAGVICAYECITSN